jgi:hypothetical protein
MTDQNIEVNRFLGPLMAKPNLDSSVPAKSSPSDLARQE